MRTLTSLEAAPAGPLEALRSFRALLESDALSNDHASFNADWENAVGIVIAFLVSGLANSVGIGGGLFWVPLFNALLGFSVKAAAAMSQACVACGTIGATTYSILLRHPLDSSRPLIDYSLATVLMPALVLGVAIGVLLNIIVPQLILAIILFIVLVLVAGRTLQQGVRQRRQEKEAAAAEAAVADARSGPEGGSAMGAEGAELRFQRSMASFKKFAGVFHRPIIPWPYVSELIVIGAIFLAFQIGKAQFDRCTWQYGVLFAVQVLIMVVATVTSLLIRTNQTSHEHAAEESMTSEEERIDSFTNEGLSTGNGMPAAPAVATSDNENNGNYSGSSSLDKREPPLPSPTPAAVVAEASAWTPRKLLFIWGIVVCVGVIAGMVGLGGGVLIAPLMLELRVHPQSSAATSTLIVLFSSIIATVTFALYGRINLSYFAVYGPICLVSGMVGTFVLSGMIRKWRMASLVTFMLAGMVVVSAGLVAGFGGRQAVVAVAEGGKVEAADFCTA